MVKYAVLSAPLMLVRVPPLCWSECPPYAGQSAPLMLVRVPPLCKLECSLMQCPLTRPTHEHQMLVKNHNIASEELAIFCFTFSATVIISINFATLKLPFSSEHSLETASTSVSVILSAVAVKTSIVLWML